MVESCIESLDIRSDLYVPHEVSAHPRLCGIVLHLGYASSFSNVISTWGMREQWSLLNNLGGDVISTFGYAPYVSRYIIRSSCNRICTGRHCGFVACISPHVREELLAKSIALWLSMLVALCSRRVCDQPVVALTLIVAGWCNPTGIVQRSIIKSHHLCRLAQYMCHILEVWCINAVASKLSSMLQPWWYWCELHSRKMCDGQ